MPIDRNFWRKPLVEWERPNLRCPCCRDGILDIIQGTLAYFETRESKHRAYPSSQFPTDDEFRFCACLKCNRDECREIVVVCGDSFTDIRVVLNAQGGPEEALEVKHVPLFFTPSLDLFQIPDSCPDSVKREIRASFSAIFSDPSSAGNKVRTAVECLLTDCGIKQFPRTGKRKPMTLHARIELFAIRDPDVGEHLLAIKWIGNAGSHVGDITRDDVFDAYDILEQVLVDLYVQPALKKLVREVNKRKGPSAKARSG